MDKDFRPSALGRLALCPASIDKTKEAREKGVALEIETDEAARGTLGHKALDPAFPIADLPSDLRGPVERAREYIRQVTAGEDLFYEWTGAYFDDLGEFKSYGTMDVLAIYRGHSLRIVDIKFGQGDLDPESLRLQTGAYALIASQAFGISYVMVFVYHAASMEDYRAAYGPEDLGRLQVEIGEIWKAVHAETKPIVPGPSQCRYCPARLACEPFKERFIDDAGVKLALEKRTEALPAQWSRILEARSALKPYMTALDKMAEKAKEEMAAGKLAIPGWKIIPRHRNGYTVEATDYFELRKDRENT